MSYRDILAAVFALEADRPALELAGALAGRFGAHATALIVAVNVGSRFAEKDAPLSEVLADIAKGPHSAAAEERERLVAWLEASSHDFEVRDLTVEGAVSNKEMIAQARLADLVVMARASQQARARRSLMEHILFQARSPLLLTSDGAPKEWRRVMIAWNAKSEAMRAVRAALPLLQKAEMVTIVTVDALPTASGHGEAPGRELAAHLARRGVAVEVRNADGMDRGDSRSLLEEAVNCAADLMVLGAYGHSRAQEFLFGGVTHDLLEAAPLPLLMAH